MSKEKFEGKSTLSPNLMHDNIQPKQRFTGYFIPVEIMEIKELSLLEKLLLSLIDSLYCKEHGGCFASNDYIASKLNVKENTIAKSITNLRKTNLIEDVSFDGRKRVIKTNLYKLVHQLQSNADLDKNPSSIGKKSNPALDKNPSPSLYRDNKGYKKEKRGGKPPSANADSPPRSNSSSKEKTIERAQHVATSDEEHQKLVELYGDEMTAEAYEVLSLWKRDTPKSKWKNSDYRSIRRWTIDAVKEKRLKEGTSDKKKEQQAELISTNQKWIKERLKGIYFYDSSISIDIRDMCVYFKKGQRMLPVGYAEPKFKEIVENQLKSIAKE